MSFTAEPELPSWAESSSYEALLEAAEPAPADFLKVDEDSIAELFYHQRQHG